MLRTVAVGIGVLLCGVAIAGGEIPERGLRPAKRYAPAQEKGEPSMESSPVTPSGRSIEGSGIHKYGHNVARSMPMPAPSRGIGHGKEKNEFYGPTYYDPWHHNVWERLNPTYYPFIRNSEWPNYKVPGDYCAGKLCGPSRSSHYWDSYDDWVRGGRYEQHQ